jgi:serine/threonine-protein kinase SRPK3
VDPYAAATGKSIEEIVDSIEEGPHAVKGGQGKHKHDVAKPKKHTTDPKRVNETEVSAEPKPEAQSDHPTEGPGQAKSQKKREKHKSDQLVLHKPGMTKAQRQELYEKRRERVTTAKEIKFSKGELEEMEDEDEDVPPEHSGEDYSDTQNERAKEYRKGGYHPVLVGELYNGRYRVVKKLGWGYFSTVWLVWDYVSEQYQAMKIQKSAQHYRDAAFDEIKLLSEIMQADPKKDRCCTRMNDFFEHTGPNGNHVCMVFDVLGENLLNLMEWYEYHGIPIPIVKAITQQVLIALEHIHSINIIHTDLKPENVLLSTPTHKVISIMKKYSPPPMYQRPALIDRDPRTMTKSQKRRYFRKLRDLRKKCDEPSVHQPSDDEDSDAEARKEQLEPNLSHEEEMQRVNAAADAASDTDPEWEVERFHCVCLADFGNSCWTYRQFTDEVQTRQYRCPEVIVGNEYGTAIDLWSCACMIFELVTGDFLFDPKQGDDYTRDEDHLALMTELLGPMPDVISRGPGKYRAHYFKSNGELRHIHNLKFWNLEDVLHEKYRFTKKKANELAEFLLPMLHPDPELRYTATEMLNRFEHFFQVQDDDYAPHCYAKHTVDDADSTKDDTNEKSSDGDHRGENADDEQDSEEFDPVYAPRASETDEQNLREWWDGHPLLNSTALAARGLTVHDIQLALSNVELPPEKQEAAMALLIEVGAFEESSDESDSADSEGDVAAEVKPNGRDVPSDGV